MITSERECILGQANMTVSQYESNRRIEELFLEAECLVDTVRQQQRETWEQIEKTRIAGEEAYGNLAALKLFCYAVGLYKDACRNAEQN